MMENNNQFRIIVLDDNEFYNRILSKEIRSYTDMLKFAFEKKIEFDIQSYISAIDCFASIHPETDLVFMDYFLDNKINATDLFQSIKKKCPKCKVVILSQTKTIGQVLEMFSEEPIQFIYKDENALSKSCMVVNDLVAAKK